MAVTATYQTLATDATNGTSYSFTSQPFGTAASDRYIVVAVLGRLSGTPLSVNSVTIGGVSATIAVSIGPDNNPIAIAYAAVPTGTTGTVDVTFTLTSLRCALAIWSVTGADFTTPTDTDTQTNTIPIGSIDVAAGGVCFGAAGNLVSSDCVWTNLTEVGQSLVETSTLSVASDVFGSAQTGLSVTAKFGASGASGSNLVLASWPAATSSGIVPLLMHRAFMGA